MIGLSTLAGSYWSGVIHPHSVGLPHKGFLLVGMAQLATNLYQLLFSPFHVTIALSSCVLIPYPLQVGDMEELGIYESFKVKQAVIVSATEAAEMILRVDDILTNAPRRREERM